MTTALCETLAEQLSDLFGCAETSRGTVRIRTPFLYPDGGVIDVFVIERGDRLSVTDLGESLGWLRSQSVSGQRTPKQNKLMADVCLTLGVELFRGQLTFRCPDAKSLATGVTRVGQAAVRVADLWFTMRTRSVESVTDEVADFLEENSIPFERAVKIPGRSGRVWTIDLQTRTPERSALVSVLTSGSRAAARKVTEHVVAGWYDLSHLRVGGPKLSFVSLFDDTSDVWTAEDFKLVEDLSEVRRWTRPDELAALLQVA